MEKILWGSSARLRDDKEIGVMAIKNKYPLAFEALSNRLRDDKELLMMTLDNKNSESEDANEIVSNALKRLQKDKDILEIMKKFKWFVERRVESMYDSSKYYE